MIEIDHALSDNLRELADLAREIGAERVILLRNPAEPFLTWYLTSRDQATITDLQLAIQTVLPLPNAGTLLVILIPASDGGQSPLQAL